MPKINTEQVPVETGTTYPDPFDQPCRARQRRKLGEAAGLSQYGVNLTRLPPGTWSAQRHWHSAEDEFVYLLSGRLVLVSDDGEEELVAGDCAGFPANDGNGHCLQNRFDEDAVYLEIGSRLPDRDGVDYPDIDMMIRPGSRDYLHKDGAPYPQQGRRTG